MKRGGAHREEGEESVVKRGGAHREEGRSLL